MNVELSELDLDDLLLCVELEMDRCEKDGEMEKDDYRHLHNLHYRLSAWREMAGDKESSPTPRVMEMVDGEYVDISPPEEDDDGKGTVKERLTRLEDFIAVLIDERMTKLKREREKKRKRKKESNGQ